MLSSQPLLYAGGHSFLGVQGSLNLLLIAFYLAQFIKHIYGLIPYQSISDEQQTLTTSYNGRAAQ